MLFYISLLTLFFSIIYCAKVKKSQRFWKTKGIKYARPTFLVGSTKLWKSKSKFKVIQDLYKQFPDERYYGYYRFTSPVLIIKDPELIKQITIKDFDHFTDHRSIISPSVDPFWNKTLYAAKGKQWRHLRDTLTPPFSSNKLKIMFSLIDECAKNWVKHFELQAKTKKVQEVEMKDIVSRFANDVIASTAFGIRCDSLKDRENDFYIMGKTIFNFRGSQVYRYLIPMFSPFLTKVLKIKIIPQKVVDYFTKVILENIQIRKEQNIIRPDMIETLLEAQQNPKIVDNPTTVDETSTILEITKNSITTDDIVSQAFIFFIAGFETVSTALSFALYELAINPQIQSRLRDEISSTKTITYEKLLEFKYLDMVLSEVLRKWPPTMFLDREVTKPYTISPVKDEKPLLLEKGVTCWILVSGLHRDPKYYPNPDCFDPERFSDENKDKIDPTTYIPFGIGQRSCIGSKFALVEIKLLLFYILRSFEIIPIKRTLVPMILDPVFLEPVHGNWLGLKKIS